MSFNNNTFFCIQNCWLCLDISNTLILPTFYNFLSIKLLFYCICPLLIFLFLRKPNLIFVSATKSFLRFKRPPVNSSHKWLFLACHSPRKIFRLMSNKKITILAERAFLEKTHYVNKVMHVCIMARSLSQALQPKTLIRRKNNIQEHYYKSCHTF